MERSTPVTQSRLDIGVGIVVTLVLVVGVVLTLQASQATTDGMGHGWGMHGVHPIWNLFGTLLIAVSIAGVYAVVRNQLPTQPTTEESAEKEPVESPTEKQKTPEIESQPEAESTTSGARSADDIVAYLPDDERRILTPVLESPGLTQIELRDRAEFSKSKVSQSVSDLEKRGLIYRESQGRTYRVYPTEKLDPETEP